MAKAKSVYRKKLPRVRVDLRVKPEVLAALRQGGAYHNIGYQTYTQWLIEDGLRIDAQYYGWAKVPVQEQPRELTPTQEKEVDRLMRIARRTVKRNKKNAPQTES